MLKAHKSPNNSYDSQPLTRHHHQILLEGARVCIQVLMPSRASKKCCLVKRGLSQCHLNGIQLYSNGSQHDTTRGWNWSFNMIQHDSSHNGHSQWQWGWLCPPGSLGRSLGPAEAIASWDANCDGVTKIDTIAWCSWGTQKNDAIAGTQLNDPWLFK